MKSFAVFFLFFKLLLPVSSGYAKSLTIAVASNFYPTLQKLAKRFQREYKIEVILSSGSTGNLFQQISYGAPFDLFLAADGKCPRLLKKTIPQTVGPWNYAQGRLVLWVPEEKGEKNIKTLLEQANLIALANPKTAPYGAAAKQYLQVHHLWSASRLKTAIAQNIATAFQFIHTGNANLGFIAYSQVLQNNLPKQSFRLLPESETGPIMQAFVITAKGSAKKAAHAFKNFLLTDKEVQQIIRHDGYLLP